MWTWWSSATAWSLKSMGPDGILPRVLQELDESIAKPLSIFGWPWKSREVPVDRKLMKLSQFSERERRTTLVTIGLSVSLQCLMEKMQKIILGCFDKHLKDNAVSCHSQHSLTRGRSGLSNLISFHDKVTHLADQEKPFDVIFSDFSKAFDIVPLRILLDKMSGTQPSWDGKRCELAHRSG